MYFSKLNVGQYFLIIILGIFAFFVLVDLVLLLFQFFKKKTRSFAEMMDEKKSNRLSLVIDLSRNIVEIYYVYETNNKTKTLNFDEFTYSLDSENLKKLQDWLEFIQNNSEYGNYRRIELQMYDDSGNKRLYRCSLQNYIPENHKYFIMAQDITVSNQMIKDYEKKLSLYDTESFYEKIQVLLKLTLENEIACIVTIRYKEYEAIVKDFKDDFVKLIDYEILNRLEAILEEDMAICQSKEATFHIFLGKVMSLSKLKQKLKKILQTCSGNIVVGKGNFNINFLAGAMIIENNDPLNCLEKSEIALNQCLKRRFFNDKIRFFDKELSIIEKENVEKLSLVKKIIDEKDFDLVYQPILDISTKKVMGYKVEISLNKEIDITKEKFISMAQEIGERKKYFMGILEKILQKDVQLPVFIVIPHSQISRFCDAYASFEDFQQIDLKIMISFENLVVSETNLVTMEKIIKGNIESNHIQFGIAISNFQIPYLNEIIYTKLNYMMIFEEVIDTSFDSTHYQIAFLTNQKIAEQYDLVMIGVDINSIYQYEKLFHMHAKYISGPLFNEKIQENQLSDQHLLKQLIELENKNKA